MKPNDAKYIEAVYDRDLMKGLNDQCDTMMNNVKFATLHSADYITSDFVFDIHDDKDKLGSVIFEAFNYGNIQSVVFCDKDDNVLKVERDFDKFNEYFEQIKNICEPDQLKDIDLIMDNFGYDPEVNHGKNTVYTFEHKANPDDKIGYSVAVGPLTESARVFGEFENQETIEDRDWTTCKWHKDLNAAEEYIKSRSDDYNKMLEEKVEEPADTTKNIEIKITDILCITSTFYSPILLYNKIRHDANSYTNNIDN